ncbi:hypothetical protein [Pedobacter sp. V48]|uniref:hypothetical protein n=1 Tax=Pedobacter sp. V48 TaxID=509635 RepID=UPI0003E4D309|nr:hypothetical protein [Pedobacter sp. V48]ETZ20979.1 hypothetical protein N824_02380 [Pedobacter sp. V48]
MIRYSTENLVLYLTSYSYQRSTPNKLALELKALEAAGAKGEEIDRKAYAGEGTIWNAAGQY